MFERNPLLPDNLWELDRHNSFGDYARAYGDEIARHYENREVIAIPYFPLDFDLALFQRMIFPKRHFKIGTANGLDRNLYIRKDLDCDIDPTHPLFQIFADPKMVAYVQAQIRSVNDQIRSALKVLFPKYYSMAEMNITWLLTETGHLAQSGNLGMHMDTFDEGKKISPREGRSQRIKLFINIDTEPRLWSTSFTMPEVLKRYRDVLPSTLPADANNVAHVLTNSGVFESVPVHNISIPPLAAVMCDAQFISHTIRYGRRMIAAEFSCDENDLLDPAQNSHRQVSDWLVSSGYIVNTDW